MAGGGGSPRWSQAGDRIFYNNADHIFEVMIARTPNPSPGAVTELVSGPALGARISPFGFERAPDNARFLFPRPTSGTTEIGGVRLIEQWIRAHRR